MVLHRELVVISGFWIASEIGLGLLRRSGSTAVRHDDRSLPILVMVIALSVVAGMWREALCPSGRIAPPFVRWSGIGVILLGIVFRWTAIATLGRFFTVDVAIQPDHRLVRTGLYRRIRHPAYSGMIVSFTGLGLATGHWMTAAIIVLPITAALVWRIRVEEGVLLKAFGREYLDYCRSTWRLFPGIF